MRSCVRSSPGVRAHVRCSPLCRRCRPRVHGCTSSSWPSKLSILSLTDLTRQDRPIGSQTSQICWSAETSQCLVHLPLQLFSQPSSSYRLSCHSPASSATLISKSPSSVTDTDGFSCSASVPAWNSNNLEYISRSATLRSQSLSMPSSPSP